MWKAPTSHMYVWSIISGLISCTGIFCPWKGPNTTLSSTAFLVNTPRPSFPETDGVICRSPGRDTLALLSFSDLNFVEASAIHLSGPWAGQYPREIWLHSSQLSARIGHMASISVSPGIRNLWICQSIKISINQNQSINIGNNEQSMTGFCDFSSIFTITERKQKSNECQLIAINTISKHLTIDWSSIDQC